MSDYNDEPLPNEFLCPITQEMMIDPVILSDGHTYERSAIQTWFDTNPSKRSPMSNEILTNTTLTINHALKKMIDRHRSKFSRKLLALCENGPISSVQIEELVEQGAETNARDSNGNTPVMLLLLKDHLGCIRTMVRLGASVLCRNDQGQSLLDMSRSKMPRDEVVVNMIHRLVTVEKKDGEEEAAADENRRRTEEAERVERAQENVHPWLNRNAWHRWWNHGRDRDGEQQQAAAAAANQNNGRFGGMGGGFFFFGFGSLGHSWWMPFAMMALYYFYYNPQIWRNGMANFERRDTVGKVSAIIYVVGLIVSLVYYQLYM